jgi:hypothetical protein
MREYLYAYDINDYEDVLLSNDIIKYVPSIVQREWHSYKLYKNNKYYIINRNKFNNSHSYFFERDYYKYELEKTENTMLQIRTYFVPIILHYQKNNIEIGIKLKLIYNKMMNYLFNDLIIIKKKFDSINY